MVATHGSTHGNLRGSRATAAGAAAPRSGQELETTMPEEDNNCPWRKTIVRQIYHPEGGLPLPPLAPQHHAIASGSLPSTPRELVQQVADDLVDQAMSNTTLSELVARVATAAVKTVLRTCARRLNALSPAAVDLLVAHDLLGSDEEDNEQAKSEEPRSQCPDTSGPSRR